MSLVSRKLKVLVLGGKGFIGRHAVRFLHQQNVEVTIGTRQPAANPEFCETGFVLHKMLEESDWIPRISEFDIVLNSVGILRQRPGESYEAVHHHAPAAIAAACNKTNARYVHVSAVGLRADARSRFNTSKLRGEKAITDVGGDYIIARISLLDGEGGFGAAWLRGIARLPVFIVPNSATGRIAALTADDAGEALARLCLNPDTNRTRTFDLGGEDSYLFEDYIRGLRRRHTSHRAIALRLPGLITRLAAHFFDLIHFSPFSFGHWEMLCYDNLPRSADLRKVLGRPGNAVVEAIE